MIRLFPDVPATQPAMGAIILNISANMLGLGNAATPFGIKAMVEMNKINPLKGTATTAMCFFLAISTSSVTLLPLNVIALRVSAKSQNPVAIWIPTLIATLCSTLVGVSVASWLGRRSKKKGEAPESQNLELEEVEIEEVEIEEVESEVVEEDYSHLLYPAGKVSKLVAWLFILGFLGSWVYGVIQAGNLG